MSKEKKGYCFKVENGDRPFQYSTEYQAWRAAVSRKDDRAITETRRAWHAKWGPR